jgi:hypothetical protein
MPKAFLRIFPPILGIWKWPRMVVIGMFANDSKKRPLHFPTPVKNSPKILIFFNMSGEYC